MHINQLKYQRQQSEAQMFHIQSPQFSSSSKCNLSSLISPTNRNKRAVSTQNYSAYINGRANSCKKLDSPSKALDKMRKRSQNSQHKNKPKEILVQMNNLKEEYMNLKTAYKDLMNQKIRQSQRDVNVQEQNMKLKQSIEKITRQNENNKGKVSFLQSQIQRIKRESIKLIQIWQFRIRKLEQTLSEKQKLISQLKQSLKSNGIEQPRPSNTKKYTKQQVEAQIQRDGLYNSLAAMSQSLIMGHYNQNTRENMSQYISVSLNSVADQIEDQNQQPSKKALYVSEQINAHLIDITNKSKQNENKKADQNFKKLRKQITKKIEVNIDQKQKQFLQQIHPKTPLDRKVNKSSKSSKIKLKKQQQNNEPKSSKKKMSGKINN